MKLVYFEISLEELIFFFRKREVNFTVKHKYKLLYLTSKSFAMWQMEKIILNCFFPIIIDFFLTTHYLFNEKMGKISNISYYSTAKKNTNKSPLKVKNKSFFIIIIKLINQLTKE